MSVHAKCVGLLFLLLLVQCADPRTERMASRYAQQGSSVGNGIGDLLEDSVDAWFVAKDRVISYCLVPPSDDFGVSLPTLRERTRAAFQQWRNYIEERQLENVAYYPERRVGETDPKIQFRASLVETCARETDLTFFFGAKPPVIERALSRYRSKERTPIALAERTHFSEWGQGVIWIESRQSFQPSLPAWPRDGYLVQEIIAHEIGHVLGNAHVEGTVMDSQAVFDKIVGPLHVRTQEQVVSPQPIEGKRWLLSPPDRFNYLEVSNGVFAHETTEFQKRVRLPFTSGWAPWGGRSRELLVLDGVNRYVFWGIREIGERHSYGDVFRYRFSDERSKVKRIFSRSESSSFSAQLGFSYECFAGGNCKEIRPIPQEGRAFLTVNGSTRLRMTFLKSFEED